MHATSLDPRLCEEFALQLKMHPQPHAVLNCRRHKSSKQIFAFCPHFLKIVNNFSCKFSAFLIFTCRPPIVPGCSASATFILPPLSCLNVAPALPGVKFYIASKIVIDFYDFTTISFLSVFPFITLSLLRTDVKMVKQTG